MPNKRNFFIFAAFFVLYELTTYISNDMIMPGMLQVVNQFKAPLEKIALSLSLFIIGGSSLQLIIGPITDKIGKKKILLFGNILFLIATLTITLSNSIDQFLGARFFQGMGMCFIFIGYAKIHELFDDKNAVKLTSILSNVSLFAPLIGPVIGSAIIAISKWQYVFIISGILGAISLVGLYKYMPNDIKISTPKVNTVKRYLDILTTKIFILGAITSGIAAVPILSWIGLAPIILVEKLKLSSLDYIIYQIIIFSGFILSSIFIQKAAGRFSIYKLIVNGSSLGLIGLLIALITESLSKNMFIFGMWVYTLGIGLFNGVLARITLTSTKEDTSTLNAAIFSLFFSLITASGLEMVNQVANRFDYSLRSFTVINLVVGIMTFAIAFYFAKLNKDRQWT